MSKNNKMTIEKLANMVAKGFANMTTKDDLTSIATKDDIVAVRAEVVTKNDLADTERRISAKIYAVEEKVDLLEEIDVRGLQHRVSILEKDIKQIKH